MRRHNPCLLHIANGINQFDGTGVGLFPNIMRIFCGIILNKGRTKRRETSEEAVETRAGEPQFRDDCMVPSPTSDHMEGAEIKEAYRRTMFDAICVTALIAYFLHFALAALRGGFREDEMMSLWIYWHAGALKSLWANVSFWTPFYRPGGALYYLPLYSFYGLNPRPYRITQIIILAASVIAGNND
jgi:hypothetical protein